MSKKEKNSNCQVLEGVVVMAKKEKRFQTSSFNYVLLNIQQREKLEDLSLEEVYQECIDSTQDCIKLQDKYGKNAVLRGMDLQENATLRERNKLIGGHNSGES